MTIDDDLNAILEHHGVKGMHWGVRKEEDSGSSKSMWTNATKNVINNAPKLTQAQKIRNYANNQKKFYAKFDGPKSDSPKSERKPLTEGQKKALKIALGVGVTAAVLGAAYYGTKHGVTPLGIYQKDKAKSKDSAWFGNQFVQPSSYKREEIHLPAGHEFTRISTMAESGWHQGTYTATNKQDYNRYLGDAFGTHKDSMGNAQGLYKVTFKSKEEIRIPTMQKTLDVFKESLDQTFGGNHTPEETILEYNVRSGGDWSDKPSKLMAKKLKALGYHGIVDEMDAGTYSDSPLVIFNHAAMGPKTAVKISRAEVVKSRVLIKPLKTPKIGISSDEWLKRQQFAYKQMSDISKAEAAKAAKEALE